MEPLHLCNKVFCALLINTFKGSKICCKNHRGCRLDQKGYRILIYSCFLLLLFIFNIKLLDISFALYFIPKPVRTNKQGKYFMDHGSSVMSSAERLGSGFAYIKKTKKHCHTAMTFKITLKGKNMLTFN